MPKKILCPVDFSDGSKAAMRSAIDLLDPDGELLLVHVFQPPIFYGPETTFPDALLVDLRVDAERALEAWKRDATEYGAKRVTTVFRIGAPWHEIVRAARDTHVDLVVISTQGRTGLAHVLLGSVAEKVVRHAPCPVHVVRQREVSP